MSLKLHLILLALLLSFLFLTSSAVPYGLKADDLVAAGDEEFLMESDISRRILISYSGVASKTQNRGHPAVVCGQPGYRACIPKANGKPPRKCGIYQRDCH